jgi:hypothetical protein
MAGLKIVNFASKFRPSPNVLASITGLSSNVTASRTFASKDDVTHTGQVCKKLQSDLQLLL